MRWRVFYKLVFFRSQFETHGLDFWDRIGGIQIGGSMLALYKA